MNLEIVLAQMILRKGPKLFFKKERLNFQAIKPFYGHKVLQKTFKSSHTFNKYVFIIIQINSYDD